MIVRREQSLECRKCKVTVRLKWIEANGKILAGSASRCCPKCGGELVVGMMCGGISVPIDERPEPYLFQEEVYNEENGR